MFYRNLYDYIYCCFYLILYTLHINLIIFYQSPKAWKVLDMLRNEKTQI